jgi:uncharacterized protein (DUF1501 family)
LRGPAPVLGWSPTWFSDVWPPTLDSVRALYRQRDPQLCGMLERGLKANNMAGDTGGKDADIGTLRQGFRGAGRLLTAADGPRIAVLCIDGWDTHTNQGGTQGQHADLLTELDTAIADFRLSVGAAWQNTVMVLATEFGRTIRINGDSGTDHGVGTVTLLAGGAVNGGQIFGDWPGLAPSQLYEGSDLRPTTDLRSVFKGVLRDHLGVPTNLLNTSIFPASVAVAPMSNLVKAGTSQMIRSAAPAASIKADAPIARYRREQQGMQVAGN